MSSSYTLQPPEITLPKSWGTVKGTQYDDKACRYAGVPYGLPPTGDFRWQKPRPIPENYSYSESDGSPFDATHFGPVCTQPDYSGQGHLLPEEAFGEDCLRVNIWTPVRKSETDTAKWPVMLWLHGGWFQVGDPSHGADMDPTELISTGGLNAIFISIGYRLSIFGFLAGKELEEDSQGASIGNYGLWDQRLAMEWIKKVIPAFGGDPDNITLAGRSAGAYSVHAQALYDFQNFQHSSEKDDMFHRLLMISNAIPAQPKKPEETQSQFDEVCVYFGVPATHSGSEKLQALRRISAKELAAGIMKLNYHTFRPVTDGLFILPEMIEYHKSGEFAKHFKARGLRLFIGEMLNEESLYGATNGPEPNFESLHLQILNYYAPSTTDRILEHYPLPKTDSRPEWTKLFGNIIADGQVRAPSRFLVDALYSQGVSIKDMWRYRISYRMSFIKAPKEWGVTHAMDRPIWNFSVVLGPTPEERVLMKEWINDLAAFVQNNKTYDYGTSEIDTFKDMKSNQKIEVEKDARWSELLDLAHIFSGN